MFNQEVKNYYEVTLFFFGKASLKTGAEHLPERQ
jgi:hypothetical protein